MLPEIKGWHCAITYECVQEIRESRAHGRDLRRQWVVSQFEIVADHVGGALLAITAAGHLESLQHLRRGLPFGVSR